jgi:hypothetical protein
MRQLVNIVAIITALLAAAGLFLFQAREQTNDAQVEVVAANVKRFQTLINLRAATKEGDLNERGFPATIDPEWFAGDPPRNDLVTLGRPWVEVAAPDEASQMNPRVRMAIKPELAAFWYNPYQGVVRARVPSAINDRKALDLYNRINGTDLDSILGQPPASILSAVVEGKDAAPGAGNSGSMDPTKPR